MCLRPQILPYIEFKYTGKKKVLFGRYNSIYFNYLQPISCDFNIPKFLAVRNDLISRDFFYDKYIRKYIKVLDLITIPCGSCVDCLKHRSKEFSIRVSCENMYNKSFDSRASAFFVTLTIADAFMRSQNSVSKRDLQLFFKRLRKAFDMPFKYFACGEYGSSNGRPHYHIIFTFEHFVDSLSFQKLVASCWHFGIIDVQDNIADSAINYTARYVDKKIESGLTSKDYLKVGIQPPFVLVSQKMGLNYFLKNRDEILSLGYIQGPNGVRYFIPSYFLRYLDPESLEAIKSSNRILAYESLNHSVQQATMNGFDSLLDLNIRLESVKKSKKSLLSRNL